MNTEPFDPYHRWLGIPPEQQPPDHYRLLGIERFESDAEVIRDAADRQMVHVRAYQLGQYSALSQQVLNELAAARVCLLNPEKKAAYDEQLQGHLEPADAAFADPVADINGETPTPPQASASIPNTGRWWAKYRRETVARVITAGVLLPVVVLLVWILGSREQARHALPIAKEQREAIQPRPPAPPVAPGAAGHGVASTSPGPSQPSEPTVPEPEVPVDYRGEVFRAWQIIGPFLYESIESAYDDAHPIETGPIDLEEVYEGTTGELRWMPHVFEQDSFDLRNIVEAPPSGKVGVYYAVCWVHIPRYTRPGSFKASYRGGHKVWIDEKPAFGIPQSFGARSGRSPFRVGWSRVLVKLIVSSRSGLRGCFELRVRMPRDPFGKPLSDELPGYRFTPPTLSPSRTLARAPSPVPEPQPARQAIREPEEEDREVDAEAGVAQIAEMPSEQARDVSDDGPASAQKDHESKATLADSGRSGLPEEAKREPVPGASQQQAMRQLLEETLNTAAARTPEERLELVNKLAALAEKAEDPTEQFVLLRRASELASEAGDAARVLQLIDRIAGQFEVDRLLAQAVMLENLAKNATGEEQIGSLVEHSADVIDEALAAERFDLAVRLAESVHLACRPSAGSEFRVEALTRRREVEQLHERWEQVQAALATLESRPDDEAAHTVIGQWYAVVRGDWDVALPHLAKCSEPALRALADRELNRPPDDATAQVELADAWWELAQAAESDASQAWFSRAETWYQQAQPHVTSPLLKAKVALRLEEITNLNLATSNDHRGTPPLAVAPFDAKQAAQHQEAWAKHLNVPVVGTNSIGMRFALIPPGEFMMGSSDDQVEQLLQEARQQNAPRAYIGRLLSEAPEHRVRITWPFALGMYPVTQAEFERVMGSNPSRFKGDPRRPVEQVSWHDAVEFCRRLSELPKEKTVGAVYRLPTEAEWEYACRAGTATRYSFGDDASQLPEYAWYRGNSNRRPQPVGQKRPNPWGLYDTYGNVREWCKDWFDDRYYANSARDDPPGASSGSLRVNRGGSSDDDAPACRSSNRSGIRPAGSTYTLGFRVVLVLPEPSR